MKKLVFLILAMSMPLCAQTQTTTLNNNGCSCTSYQGAYLPVTNVGNVAYVHMNPFAAPRFFETLDSKLHCAPGVDRFRGCPCAQRVSTLSKRNLEWREGLYPPDFHAEVLPERVHIGFRWRHVSFANPIKSFHFPKKSSIHADSGTGSNLLAGPIPGSRGETGVSPVWRAGRPQLHRLGYNE